jgi:predicted nucleic acid-binding protein
MPTLLAASKVFKLAKELKLAKGGIFDCIIAVTAKENKIDIIYTENFGDFENYDFINKMTMAIFLFAEELYLNC